MCPWSQFNSPVSSNSPESTDKISCSRYLFVNSHILDVKMHSASSACKWCKGAAGHGRLPAFYIVQTNSVNAQGKSWTGEMDDRNRRVETHCKNAGVSCFTTPRHLFTDNRSSGFCTVFRTASSASGWPCKSLRFPFIGWSLTPEGRRETRHPFESGQNPARLITVRNAFHVILIIAHIYLTNVCEFLLQSCHLVDILKYRHTEAAFFEM